MREIWSSWKTTSAAIGLVAITIVFLLGKLGLNEFLAALALLSAGGLGFAKDASSHSTRDQVEDATWSQANKTRAAETKKIS